MDGMIQQIKDPLLQKIKDDIEAKLPADLQDDYLRIIVAGMKILFSPQTHRMAVNALTSSAKQSGPYKAVALGTVTLISIIARESKGKISIPAAFPASIVLMCMGFEFVEKMHNLTITPQVVADATKVVTIGLMKLFGITQEKLAEGIEYARKQRGTATPADAPAQAGEGVTPAAPPTPTPPQAGATR